MTAGILPDLVGQEFGKAKVISRSGSTPEGMSTWNTRCACGEMFVANARVFREFSKKGYEPKCFKCKKPSLQNLLLANQKRREEPSPVVKPTSSFLPSENAKQRPVQKPKPLTKQPLAKTTTFQTVKSEIENLKRYQATLVRLLTLAAHFESDEVGFLVIAKTILETHNHMNQSVDAIRLAFNSQ